VVYDPFMGRGTTPLEAALLGRVPWGNDINPLSRTLTAPRLRPPTLEQIEARLQKITCADHEEFPKQLLAFYHPDTLREICALKKYFSARKLDATDDWLRLVALNRLTGHSPGFFSVYTLPPNQAVSLASQHRINAQAPPDSAVPRRRQTHSEKIPATAPRRHAGDSSGFAAVARSARFTNSPAATTRKLPANSVSLVVTSPPFLDVVQYAEDNWLRCWFLGIDPKTVALTVPKED
jgi:hypothetical protein